ncbi:hypothetical protein BCR43DRAFT_496443 [Syncephalastrum racemosum]|uniref:Zn(2)-C6 fungal-type domain-containing protein n=1 Tax=Syncephalastrum racemosum TaxID=13706 RepID=A0A1X2H4B6_SYNRA|nr:hypothetical protein BCR43DRAFT_496443 [Syncephalastrum racemosum]
MPGDEPPQATMEPRKKRAKIVSACSECRRKKTKCNGEQPCRNCQKSSVPCVYPSATQNDDRRNAPSKAALEAIEHRLKTIEDMLRTILQSQLSVADLDPTAVNNFLNRDNHTTTSASQSPSPRPVHYPPPHHSPPLSHPGTPLLHHHNTTQQQQQQQIQQQSTPQRQAPPPSSSSSSSSSHHLPSQQQQQQQTSATSSSSSHHHPHSHHHHPQQQASPPRPSSAGPQSPPLQRPMPTAPPPHDYRLPSIHNLSAPSSAYPRLIDSSHHHEPSSQPPLQNKQQQQPQQQHDLPPVGFHAYYASSSPSYPDDRSDPEDFSLHNIKKRKR